MRYSLGWRGRRWWRALFEILTWLDWTSLAWVCLKFIFVLIGKIFRLPSKCFWVMMLIETSVSTIFALWIILGVATSDALGVEDIFGIWIEAICTFGSAFLLCWVPAILCLVVFLRPIIITVSFVLIFGCVQVTLCFFVSHRFFSVQSRRVALSRIILFKIIFSILRASWIFFGVCALPHFQRPPLARLLDGMELSLWWSVELVLNNLSIPEILFPRIKLLVKVCVKTVEVGCVVTVFHDATNICVETDFVPNDVVCFFDDIQFSQTALIIREIFVGVSEILFCFSKLIHIFEIVWTLLWGFWCRKYLLWVVVLLVVTVRALVFWIQVFVVPLSCKISLIKTVPHSSFLFLLILFQPLLAGLIPLPVISLKSVWLHRHHFLATIFFEFWLQRTVLLLHLLLYPILLVNSFLTWLFSTLRLLLSIISLCDFDIFNRRYSLSILISLMLSFKSWTTLFSQLILLFIRMRQLLLLFLIRIDFFVVA